VPTLMLLSCGVVFFVPASTTLGRSKRISDLGYLVMHVYREAPVVLAVVVCEIAREIRIHMMSWVCNLCASKTMG